MNIKFAKIQIMREFILRKQQNKENACSFVPLVLEVNLNLTQFPKVHFIFFFHNY
jgi:hypothetical protein